MKEPIPYLDPRTQETRFVMHEHYYAKFPIVPPPSLRLDMAPPMYLDVEIIDAMAREYASPALGWRGLVGSSKADEGRVLAALRVAESVILFFAALARHAR